MIYHLKCEACNTELGEFTIPIADYDNVVPLMSCPVCEKVGEVRPIMDGFPALHFGKGTGTYQRNVMQERFKKRDEKLDKLDPIQKQRMAKFMDRYGVRKTAPMDIPPKKIKE